MQKKILIVEDDVQLLDALEKKFIHESFFVFLARDGREGLEVAVRETPDIIILDLVMPKIGGWEMLRSLRLISDWGKNVPVIILSNLNPNDDIQMAHITKLEPSYFLEKATWDIGDVVKKVKERLEL